MTLTAKQKRFVEEYLIDLNATRAYRAAGYKGNDNVCAVEGLKLLRNPKIAPAIQKAMDERSKRTNVTADRVLQELARLGFSDVRKLFTETGALRRIEDLDDDAAAFVSSVEVVTKKVPGSEESEVEHTAKVRLWDKNSALEKLGKHLKLFTEKVEHEVALALDPSSLPPALRFLAEHSGKGGNGPDAASG